MWMKKLRLRDTHLFQESNIQKTILLKVPNHILKYLTGPVPLHADTQCDLAVLQLETGPLSKAECHLYTEQHSKQSTSSTS